MIYCLCPDLWSFSACFNMLTFLFLSDLYRIKSIGLIQLIDNHQYNFKNLKIDTCNIVSDFFVWFFLKKYHSEKNTLKENLSTCESQKRSSSFITVYYYYISFLFCKFTNNSEGIVLFIRKIICRLSPTFTCICSSLVFFILCKVLFKIKCFQLLKWASDPLLSWQSHSEFYIFKLTKKLYMLIITPQPVFSQRLKIYRKWSILQVFSFIVKFYLAVKNKYYIFSSLDWLRQKGNSG